MGRGGVQPARTHNLLPRAEEEARGVAGGGSRPRDGVKWCSLVMVMLSVTHITGQMASGRHTPHCLQLNITPRSIVLACPRLSRHQGCVYWSGDRGSGIIHEMRCGRARIGTEALADLTVSFIACGKSKCSVARPGGRAPDEQNPRRASAFFVLRR